MKTKRVFGIVRCIVGITVLLLFGLIPSYASAGEDGITFTSALKFSAGIVSGFLIHEGSHALVGGLTGTAMQWQIGTINQPLLFVENADANWKGFAINSAGLLSQVVGSEVILQVDRIDKNDAFVRGLMTCNILNPIFYSLDYWFFHSTNKILPNGAQGDLAGIEYYSGKAAADGFALAWIPMLVF